MKEITLGKPIEINGVERSTLTYDTDKLTIEQFAKAEGGAREKTQSVIGMAEFDYTLHFYIGAYSVISVNPEIDITDMERISGRDIMKVANIGRFFTMRSEESEEDDSDVPSESTPENSQPRSQTSGECPSPSSSETTAKP